jgi:hypothetical protein
MSAEFLPDKAFIVVADETIARFYRMPGHDIKTELFAEGVFRSEHASAGADDPPFAKLLADELHRRASLGDFASVILIATPRTLAQMRPLLHADVVARVAREIAQSLTSSTHDDILRAIEA